MSITSSSPIQGISEVVRERETFRYYPALIDDAIPNCPDDLVPSSRLKTSCDTALTAFCQLAALRLGCARSLVSLFDRDSQFVVAEATATSSLAPSTAPSTANDSLWLSGTSFPRTFGVCDRVLVSAAKAPPPSPPPQAGHAGPGAQDKPQPTVTVIDDLVADDAFSDRPYCYTWPNNRFYAGVPLQTPRGLTIGVLCVFDHKPRSGLDDAQKTVLQEIGSAVMSYLEGRRVTDKYRQADRVTRGIRAFFHGSMSSGPPRGHGRGQAQGQGFAPASRLSSDASGTTAELDGDLDIDSNGNFEGDAATDLRRAAIRAALPTRKSLSDTSSQPVPVLSHHPKITSIPETAAATAGDLFTPCEDGHDKTQRTLIRGCNIFRNALGLDGLLLLDASVSISVPSASDSPTVGHVRGNAGGAIVATGDELDNTGAGVRGPGAAICSVLGSATSSDAKQDRDSYFGNSILREKTLGKLLRHFPRGTIWNFDEGGKMDSSEASSDETDCDQSRRFSVSRELGEEVLRLLPNARSVAFFPIWDTQKQRWFAGGFAHSEKPTRVLSFKAELSYLRAFGAVVMSEVSALREQDVERSKLGVLNSMSHELRSPLHGIIVGTEMMQESSLDTSQEDTLRSIEVCSRTLLDTIDQILDWTKINRFASSPGSRPSDEVTTPGSRVSCLSRKGSFQAGLMSLTSKVDLVTLVEDVVESVYAGHEFQSSSYKSDDNNNNSNITINNTRRPSEPIMFEGKDVKVMINVLPSNSWTFRVQAGAIRRIIMNILGNSLKFTTQGLVYVQVEQLEPKTGATATNARTIRFTIADTGCGISKDYLAHGVFLPFSQEDSMEPGTGLGLTVVKRLVQSLGGTIEIRSTPSVGTTVRVSLPLELCLDESRPLPSTVARRSQNKELAAQLGDLKGLRVCLVGFDDDNCQGMFDSPLKSPISQRGNMASICQEWLGLDVVGSLEDGGMLPDLVICNHVDDSSTSLSAWAAKTIPLLVICRSALAATRMAASYNENSTMGRAWTHFTHQPLGPRKLARALDRLLRHWMSKQPLHEEQQPMVLNIPSRPPSFRLNDPITPPATGKQSPLHALETSTQTSGALRPCLPQELQQSFEPTPDEKHNPFAAPPQPASNLFLLVDDNPINLKMLIAFMKKLGHPYKTATNGEEGVARYREHPSRYKCILMDISMPVMNGFEATRAIRAIEVDQNLARCTILALTGLASQESQTEAFLCGIDLFLTKPIKLAELRQILDLRNLA